MNVSQCIEQAINPSTGLVTSLPATNISYSFPVVTRLSVLGANVFRRATKRCGSRDTIATSFAGSPIPDDTILQIAAGHFRFQAH